MAKVIDSSMLGGTTVCYPSSISPRFTLERALQGIANAGLRYVELLALTGSGYCEHLKPSNMGDKEIEEVRRLLLKYGLTASAISTDADLTTDAGLGELGDVMRVARALGAGTIIANVDKTDTEEGQNRFLRLVPTIVSGAAQHDVVIAFETHGAMITTGVQGVELLKQLGSDRLRLTYDIANVIYLAGVSPVNDLTELGTEIGRFISRVHLKDKANMAVKDYDFPVFGTGLMDFGRVLDLLHAGCYRGLLTLEVELDGKPESPELVDQALVRSYNYLRQFWAEKG